EGNVNMFIAIGAVLALAWMGIVIWTTTAHRNYLWKYRQRAGLYLPKYSRLIAPPQKLSDIKLLSRRQEDAIVEAARRSAVRRVKLMFVAMASIVIFFVVLIVLFIVMGSE